MFFVQISSESIIGFHTHSFSPPAASITINIMKKSADPYTREAELNPCTMITRVEKNSYMVLFYFFYTVVETFTFELNIFILLITCRKCRKYVIEIQQEKRWNLYLLTPFYKNEQTYAIFIGKCLLFFLYHELL